MENKEVKLAPPWITYYRQVEALFGADPDIKVAFDEDELHIKLYVENEIKAAALDEILPVHLRDPGVLRYRPFHLPGGREDGQPFRSHPVHQRCCVCHHLFLHGEHSPECPQAASEDKGHQIPVLCDEL